MFTTSHTKPATALAILVGAALAMSAAPTPASAATTSQAAATASQAATVTAHATMPTKQATKVKIKGGKVKVTGTVRVGKKLTFKVSGFTASPKPAGLKYTYKVYRSGKAKAVYSKTTTATKVKYTVKQADKGHKITVKVTAKPTGKGKAGFRNGTAKVTTKVVGKKLASTNKAAPKAAHVTVLNFASALPTAPCNTDVPSSARVLSSSQYKAFAKRCQPTWDAEAKAAKEAKAARTTTAAPGVYWNLHASTGTWFLNSCTVRSNGHSTNHKASVVSDYDDSNAAKRAFQARYFTENGYVKTSAHSGTYVTSSELAAICVNW
ncbi:MAG: hypothetical protein LBH13_10195 [Cellulomonadaceae bacterium]|jgi:hypothetical protein|nr:hypothetical protein [Cellulomonadaceae bacterium]